MASRETPERPEIDARASPASHVSVKGVPEAVPCTESFTPSMPPAVQSPTAHSDPFLASRALASPVANIFMQRSVVRSTS